MANAPPEVRDQHQRILEQQARQNSMEANLAHLQAKQGGAAP